MSILNRGRSEKYADQAGSIILYLAVDYTRKRRRIAMKKIKLFPAPHIEIRISVSDEMERDYLECQRRFESGDRDLQCGNCGWKDVKISSYCSACMLNGLDEQIRGKKNG